MRQTEQVSAYENELAQIVAELNRTSSGTRAPTPETTAAVAADSASLDQVLAQAVRAGASDLLLIAGVPVTFRVGGNLTPASTTPLGPPWIPGVADGSRGAG